MFDILQSLWKFVTSNKSKNHIGRAKDIQQPLTLIRSGVSGSNSQSTEQDWPDIEMNIGQARAEAAEKIAEQVRADAEKIADQARAEEIQRVADLKAAYPDDPKTAMKAFESGQQGDFMASARQMFKAGKAKTMTEAMKKVNRRNPALHEAYIEKSRSVPKADYGMDAI